MAGDESSLNAKDEAMLEESQRGLDRRRADLGIEPPSDTGARVVALADQQSRHQKARGRKNQGKRNLDPRAEIDNALDDQAHPLSTLVPEGEYVLSFVKEELASNFGREVWFVTLQIAEGDYKDQRLLRFYNPPRKGVHLARSSSLAQDFMEVTGLRPPSKGFRPSELLDGVLVRAYVITVKDRPPNKRDRERLRREKKKPTRIEIPSDQRYSRVDSIHGIIAGSPRILGSRHARR